MAKLPWWLFLVVGIPVTIISLFVEGLLAFAIVGAVFIIVGFIKAIFMSVEIKKETKKHFPKFQKIEHRQEKKPFNQQYKTGYCPNCGHIVHLNQNFCHYCGYKLKDI